MVTEYVQDLVKECNVFTYVIALKTTIFNNINKRFCMNERNNGPIDDFDVF